MKSNLSNSKGGSGSPNGGAQSPKQRTSNASKKSKEIHEKTAREHLLAKIVPDEEEDAPSKYQKADDKLLYSMHVEVVLLVLLSVLLLFL